MTRTIAFLSAALLFVALAGGAARTASAGNGYAVNYLVVFGDGYAVDDDYAVEDTYAVLCTYAVGGNYAVTGQYAVGCNYAVTNLYAVYAVAHQYAVSLVTAAGGTVVGDMLKQTGVMVVQSKNEQFANLMSSYAVVDEVGRTSASRPCRVAHPGRRTGGDDRPAGVHAVEHAPDPGARRAQDPGGLARRRRRHPRHRIDGGHLDFRDPANPLGSNVDCARGHDSLGVLPSGSRSVVRILRRQRLPRHACRRDRGRAGEQPRVVGVAPNVTLVPVKVCDASGYCYASAVVDGITYAGDKKLDVINMSFFIDDDEFQTSTEFKCSNNESLRAFRQSVERAIQYARNQGVTPVAALGNSDKDLSHPDEGNACEVVPAETASVIATAALGNAKEKASYSNWGTGATDVTAPGGTSTGDRRPECSRRSPATRGPRSPAPRWRRRTRPASLP